MQVNSVPPPPPYWTQPATAMPRRRSSSSPLVSPPLLIILLPILTFIFLFFAIPPFLSLTSQIFRPITVKRSWDWLNLFLVLFAILCGIFARRNDDESIAEEEINNVDTNAVDNVSDYVNLPSVVAESEFVSLNRTPGTAGFRLRRSSSSYPDLRQESMWENGDDPRRFHFRFFDDFEINNYRTVPNSFDHDHQPRRRSLNDDSKIKAIPVDAFDLRPSTPPKSPAPPPPPPPAPSPPSAHHKPRRTYRTVGRKENVPEKIDNNIVNEEFARVRSPPQAPPPPPPRPPPPPPSPARIRSDQKHGKLERRKSNVKKEITMAFSSLYNQRKRKKKQNITNPNFDSAIVSPTEQSSHHTTIPPPSPPPPPPPPPPPSVFHNLFKKGSKSKKIHSVPAPPPPPPPPISSSSRSSKHKTRSIPPSPPAPPPERSRWKPSTSSGRPPLPTKSSFYEENPINSGCQSPMNIPVPPPPPSFRMPEVKFLFRGDFVRIRSAQSSRCGSPEPDDADRSPVEVSQSEKVNVMDGGDGICAVTCPSPDVNIKADTFIARLRDGWRLEKINSIREKEKI